jgi:hypothetical protein
MLLMKAADFPKKYRERIIPGMEGLYHNGDITGQHYAGGDKTGI